MIIAANNPKLKSWVEVPEESDFPIQNIPFGIFSTNIHGTLQSLDGKLSLKRYL